MAILRRIGSSDSSGADIALQGRRTLIGRDAECDLVVNMGLVSRRHAIIYNHGGRYFIEDLDSANGTYVNGRRVHKRVPLRSNDRIEIYGLTATFIDDQEQPVVESAATMLGGPAPEDETPSNIASWVDAGGDLTGRVDVAPAAKLRAILEITRTLGASLELKEILPKILESLFAVFPQVDRGFVILPDERNGQLVAKAVRQRNPRFAQEALFSRTIVNHVLTTSRAVLSSDAQKDTQFEPSRSLEQIKIQSILCVPMLGDGNKALGAIQLDSLERRSQFTNDDLDVLVIAASQAARAVELANLHYERRDLTAATKIQKSFLPSERPKAPGLEFFDFYNSALHVGGDYFDYIPLPGNRLAVTLGDVSGKGVSASLLMARMSSAARFFLATEPSPLDAVNRLNMFLANADLDDRFVTFVAAIIDLATFSMTLINAGHLPPVLRKQSSAECIELAAEAIGLPLAVLTRPYQPAAFTLDPGDVVVLYTDGVTEARSPGGELYAIERMRMAVQSAPHGVTTIGDKILTDVRAFMAGRPQADDMTIVCFGRV